VKAPPEVLRVADNGIVLRNVTSGFSPLAFKVLGEWLSEPATESRSGRDAERSL